MSFYQKTSENTFLVKVKVKIKPNTTKNNVLGVLDGFLLLQIRERAVSGRANKEIAFYLAELLKVKKTECTLIYGHRNKEKIFKIEKKFLDLSFLNEKFSKEFSPKDLSL